jgi:four helix bundle protein
MRNKGARGMENSEQKVRGFQDLTVWRKAMELCEEIYRATEKMPAHEQFGLTQQLRRAAISIPSNIAEGHSRQSTGDYRHHLQMARGSAAEVQTQLLLAERLYLLPKTMILKALQLSEECSRILATLIRKFRNEEGGMRN